MNLPFFRILLCHDRFEINAYNMHILVVLVRIMKEEGDIFSRIETQVMSKVIVLGFHI